MRDTTVNVIDGLLALELLRIKLLPRVILPATTVATLSYQESLQVKISVSPSARCNYPHVRYGWHCARHKAYFTIWIKMSL